MLRAYIVETIDKTVRQAVSVKPGDSMVAAVRSISTMKFQGPLSLSQGTWGSDRAALAEPARQCTALQIARTTGSWQSDPRQGPSQRALSLKRFTAASSSYHRHGFTDKDGQGGSQWL